MTHLFSCTPTKPQHKAGMSRSIVHFATQAALSGADLVLHTAGPFQRKASQLVLKTAIAMGIPYVDVCDDAEYAQDCKKLHQRAVDAGVPAITTAGIYPGARSCETRDLLGPLRS